MWPQASFVRRERRCGRSDLPKRRNRKSANRDLDADHGDRVAAQILAQDMHTASSRKSIEAWVTWWSARTKARGLLPFPLTESKLWLAGALLKKGGYRSAEKYLYAVRRRHINLGYQWLEGWTPLLTDIRRSCKRGMGPPNRAAVLDGPGTVIVYEHEMVAGMGDAITVVAHGFCGKWSLLR